MEVGERGVEVGFVGVSGGGLMGEDSFSRGEVGIGGGGGDREDLEEGGEFGKRSVEKWEKLEGGGKGMSELRIKGNLG